MKYVLFGIVAALAMPVLIVALLCLYYAPASVRNTVCLILSVVGLIVATTWLIKEGRNR